jgi:hypothetical protein
LIFRPGKPGRRKQAGGGEKNHEQDKHGFTPHRYSIGLAFVRHINLGLYLVFPILSEGIESCVGEEECRCLAWGEEQGSGQNRLAGSVWV